MSNYLNYLPDELYPIIISFMLDSDAVDFFNLIEAYDEPVPIDERSLGYKMGISFLINKGIYSSFKAASEYFHDDILNLFQLVIKYAVNNYDYSDDNFMQKYHSMLENLNLLPQDIHTADLLSIIWLYLNYLLIYNYMKNDPSNKSGEIKPYKVVNLIKELDNTAELSFYYLRYLNEDHIIQILELWEKKNIDNFRLSDIDIHRQSFNKVKLYKPKLQSFLEQKGIQIID